MKLSKGKLIAIGVGVLCIVGVGIFVYSGTKGKTDDVVKSEEAPIELVPVDESQEDNVPDDSTEDVVLKEVTDSKDFVYDPFAEDAGWGNESIFGNHIIIEGTGKRDTSLGSSNVVVDGEETGTENTAEKNTRELTAAEANAALMEEVKSLDYNYRINANDFSKGFGLYSNPKYEMSVGAIMEETGYINAPNGTEVGITELDPNKSVIEHRKDQLISLAYGSYASWGDVPSIPHDTPITLDGGVEDFENTDYVSLWNGIDFTGNDYGSRLFCDEEAESKFGKGIYIEAYSPDSTLYCGYYICEHNGRIFKATGRSQYQNTLRDITLAALDTCVYPY